MNNTTDLQKAKKEAKIVINSEFKIKWESHIRSLVLQGRFIELLQESEGNLSWKSVLYNLPRNVLQFFANSSIDTLPTNSNLVRWNKRSSPNCKLCGNKETLLHTFNNCKNMLTQGRYTWRHDSILSKIVSFIEPNLPDTLKLFCDLPGQFSGISTIPTDIVVTSLKPDISIVNYSDKSCTIIELTVPFDSNIVKANERKSKKSDNLVQDIEENNFTVDFYAIEISSRGLITKDNKLRFNKIIKDLKLNTGKKQENELFKTMQKIAIVASYIIFHSKYDNEWYDPKLIQF